MIKLEIEREYFDWMCELIGDTQRPTGSSYTKLLRYLNLVEYTYSFKKDMNRAEDGIDLRHRFTFEHDLGDLSDILDGPCSLLEMMIALAVRCEEFMDDPSVGNRTGQWFWQMVVNLGLGSMTDRLFNARYVDEVIVRFLNREYEPNGKGGLFKVRNCNIDMRKTEIWAQLCYYLDSMV